MKTRRSFGRTNRDHQICREQDVEDKQRHVRWMAQEGFKAKSNKTKRQKRRMPLEGVLLAVSPKGLSKTKRLEFL